MMRRTLFLSVILTLVVAVYPVSTPEPTLAQGNGDTSHLITLAERVHVQNIRTANFTQWIGGSLGGDVENLEAAYGNVIRVGENVNGWALREFYDDTSYVGVDAVERPVVMNLWASWCGPCVFEFPLLVETSQQAGLNYDLWFVNTGDTSHSAAYRFLRDQPEDITVYYDEADEFARRIGLRVYPTTILMDTDGTIILAHWGIVTPLVMEFINEVAVNPTVGEFDNSTVEVGDIVADIAEVDVETAEPIVYSQQLTGEITNEDWQQNYRFEGDEGDEIIIDMATADEDLDPYLVVLGPDGERVAENDDGPEHPNAQVELTLPEKGTYVIVATRFLEAEGFSGGNYSLVLRENNDNALNNAIVANIPLEGSLTADKTQDYYLFAGKAEQVVTFRLEHDLVDQEHLNFQVRIGASDRIVPFTETENGFLEMEVTLPETTDYSIYVSRPMRSRAGAINYTLTVVTEVLGDVDIQIDEPTDTADEDAAPEAEDEAESVDEEATVEEDTTTRDEPEENIVYDTDFLTYGDTTFGEITDTNDIVEFFFSGAEGDIVTIRMSATRGNLDTELYLIGPTGAMVAANDDYGLEQDSVIYRFVLPLDGEYTILATRFTTSGLGGTGDFRLSVQLEEAMIVVDNSPDVETAPPANNNGGTVVVVGASIANGDEVTGLIDNTYYEVRYTFQGNRGDTINIQMDAISGDLDPFIAVYNSTGKQIAFNDDDIYSAASDAFIQEVTLFSDDTYTIVATRYAGEHGFTSGEFNLRFWVSD